MSSLSGVGLSRGYIPEDECKEQEPVIRAERITPQEQLNRLALSSLREVVCTKLDSLPDTLKESVVERAVQLILKRSGVSDERAEPQILSLFDRTITQLLKVKPLPSCLTNWHTALKRLSVLPKKIPPLPKDIIGILESECPIHGDQNKPDGTPFLVKDTHVLYLIPEELGTLNHFESEILKPYGEEKYGDGDQNPLQFRFFWDAACQEHGDVPFEDSHWVLMSKDVLPESRSKSWMVQAALVDALAEKALVNYEAPSLREAFAVMMLHKVATGESLYQVGNNPNGYRYIYTRVKETTYGYRLAVGGFAPSGVIVHSLYDCDFENCGVGALRKF